MFKLKKISLIIFLSAVMAALPYAPVAYADSIDVPNNPFAIAHYNEFTLVNRQFYANGQTGRVTLKDEPGSSKETYTVENGEIINIIFTYDYNGETWGVTELYTAQTVFEKNPSGWVPMSDLLLKYDGLQFYNDHKDEMYDYARNYTLPAAGETFLFWTWPGSGEYFKQTAYVGAPLVIDSVYKDEQDREWGYVLGYWGGIRDKWLCLSDMNNTDISAFYPEPAPRLWADDSNPKTGGGLSLPLTVIILVCAVVVVTAVLVRVKFKKREEK